MRTFILAIAATILVPSAALAGGYVIPNESPRALGLSQAAVANETGADAIFLNTAALAGQEGFDASAAGELLVNRTDWSDPSLGSASLIPQANMPPTAAVSYGQKLDNGMAWGAGAGVGVPAGGSLKWPNGWAGQEAIQSVSQQVFAIGIGAAFQPLPYLKLGASYLRFQAVEELHQSINYLDHYGDADLAMSGGANGFGVAAEVKVPTIPLTIGVTYSHSADLPLTGDVHFTAVPAAFQPMIHDQGVTEHLTIPNVLFVGAAYQVMPNLTVMAAYDFERWSVYKSDMFVGDSGFSVTVPRNYNNAYVMRLAGEWQKLPFLPQLTARAGILRSISDQPVDTVSPSLTDGNSWAVSVGGGYNVTPGLRVDLGYQHAFFDDVTAMGPEAFPGSYKTQVDLVSLGVNWRSDLDFLLGRHTRN
ncbi:MAG TPA: outer membrane protein transport protein [Kofleriaceae bacterium]|jgi:long-chain fatty acid transport protein|nr:outer membrane protein transport protein [Kofleriaceae bacterium]